jgi:hypothetical protein
MRNKTEAEIDEDTYLTPNNPNIIEKLIWSKQIVEKTHFRT